MGVFATMFSDISASLFRRPATEQYPLKRTDAPLKLRGMLHIKLEACTGCGLCVMDCPADAIQVIMLDRKAKRFVVNYHVDRCTFCGQCTLSCHQGALSMASHEWELASLNKAPFLIHFGKASDVEQTLAGTPEGEPAKSEHSE
ncbi:MAG: 4Fe-4S binding protein [Anaerolineales bacterium]